MSKIKVMYHLLVLGSGGTGTYFLKEASRMISSNATMQRSLAFLSIMDGDNVEEKNLSRQCFQREDIGRKKACVMAEVLNETFGLKWSAFPTYLTSKDSLSTVMHLSDYYSDARKHIPVIIGCVDNHAARLQCEEFFDAQNDCIYFDAANEYDTGECVFAYKLNQKIIGPCRSHYFPEIKDSDLRPVTEISCEELNKVAPQHIITNMASGMQLLSGFSNLMDGRVAPGLSFFNPFTFHSEFVEYKEK